MLSRFKKELSQLEDTPPSKYLDKIALKKSEYNEIRKTASATRRRGALSVQIISNADAILIQAMQYIVSSDPNLLMAAIYPLSGLRLIEIVKGR